MDLHFISIFQIWGTVAGLLIRTLQSFVHPQEKVWKLMVPVNKGVGWAGRRSIGTNKQHLLQGYGPTLHPRSSNFRHTFQFPHHSASNFVHSQGIIQEKWWYPWTRLSNGKPDARRTPTNSIPFKDMDLPFIPNPQIWGTPSSFLIKALQTFVHSQGRMH